MNTLSNDLKNLLVADIKQTVVLQMVENNDFCHSNLEIKTRLNKLLVPYFPNIDIFTFGSREIGVATGDSDLDIYVDTDDTYFQLGFEKNLEQLISKVRQILIQSKQWQNIFVVNAKVPLIKALHKTEGVECDISFSDGLGHKNTELVKFFCKIQPIMKDMIVFLKLWLEVAELTNSINSYTLTLLIMNFLQHNRFLPSIKLLQEGVRNPKKIGPWIVEYDETLINRIHLNTTNDLEGLIIEFFKFFGSASKFNNVICTYLGILAPPTYFKNRTIKSLKQYYTFINTYEHEAYTFSAMNVQGPFNLAENPAKQVSSKNLQKFVKLCSTSYKWMISN